MIRPLACNLDKEFDALELDKNLPYGRDDSPTRAKASVAFWDHLQQHEVPNPLSMLSDSLEAGNAMHSSWSGCARYNSGL